MVNKITIWHGGKEVGTLNAVNVHINNGRFVNGCGVAYITLDIQELHWYPDFINDLKGKLNDTLLDMSFDICCDGMGGFGWNGVEPAMWFHTARFQSYNEVEDSSTGMKISSAQMWATSIMTLPKEQVVNEAERCPQCGEIH